MLLTEDLWIFNLFYTVRSTLQVKKHFGRNSFFTCAGVDVLIKDEETLWEKQFRSEETLFSLFNNQSNCGYAVLYRINALRLSILP